MATGETARNRVGVLVFNLCSTQDHSFQPIPFLKQIPDQRVLLSVGREFYVGIKCGIVIERRIQHIFGTGDSITIRIQRNGVLTQQGVFLTLTIAPPWISLFVFLIKKVMHLIWSEIPMKKVVDVIMNTLKLP